MNYSICLYIQSQTRIFSRGNKNASPASCLARGDAFLVDYEIHPLIEQLE